ncbi:MAG: hypothetical protein KJ600_04725 [Nanoarchaeota archaeon]|nr:hypothetical protein [Nanoarchaeota archaeon]MBU1103833.1 hypothetical protein [Nanoarchaeota archaeon]
MFRKPADGVVFADDKIEGAFNSLREDDWLKRAIQRAIDDLKINVFCGERIPKKQIPKEYIQKHGIDNLWRYSLPNAWRLIYSVIAPSNVEILAVILEYFNHKNYERRFRY